MTHHHCVSASLFVHCAIHAEHSISSLNRALPTHYATHPRAALAFSAKRVHSEHAQADSATVSSSSTPIGSPDKRSHTDVPLAAAEAFSRAVVAENVLAFVGPGHQSFVTVNTVWKQAY